MVFIIVREGFYPQAYSIGGCDFKQFGPIILFPGFSRLTTGFKNNP